MLNVFSASSARVPCRAELHANSGSVFSPRASVFNMIHYFCARFMRALWRAPRARLKLKNIGPFFSSLVLRWCLWHDLTLRVTLLFSHQIDNVGVDREEQEANAALPAVTGQISFVYTFLQHGVSRKRCVHCADG